MNLFSLKERQYKEQQQANKYSDTMLKLTEKEGRLIEMLEHTDYSVEDLSMILMKAQFLQNDIKECIDKISKSGMIKEIVEIQLLTLSQLSKRVEDMIIRLTTVVNNTKQANLIKVEADQKEMLVNLIKVVNKERKEDES